MRPSSRIARTNAIERYRLRPALWGLLAASLLLARSDAQEVPTPGSDTVHQHVLPGGIRYYKDGVRGEKLVRLLNSSDQPAEIVTGGYFEGAPLQRFGRKIQLPPRSVRIIGFPVVPTQDAQRAIRWQSMLYSTAEEDRGGLLRAADDYFIDAEGLPIPDEEMMAVIGDFLHPAPNFDSEIDYLARVLHVATGNSKKVTELDVSEVPDMIGGLDVIDRIVLASDQIATCPTKLNCLREWVEQGGQLWINLTQVDVSTVKALFGDTISLQVVDRTSLTSVPLVQSGLDPANATAREFDYPAALVRTLVDDVRIVHEVDGWPASFVCEIGRGRVACVTMDNRIWMRLRTPADEAVPANIHTKYVALRPALELVNAWTRQTDPWPAADNLFEAYLESQLGYQIPRRSVIFSLLSAFCVLLLGTGLWLQRSDTSRMPDDTESTKASSVGRRRERMVIIGPLLAFLTAIPIVVVGQAARSSVPPSVRMAEFVQINPSSSTMNSTGSAALFSPDSTVVSLESRHGHSLIPPRERLSGTMQQTLQTDHDQIDLPDFDINSGLQFFRTRQSTLLDKPVRAVVEFGPNGVTGTLQMGAYANPADVIIASRAQNVLAISMARKDKIRAQQNATLDPDVYISGALLNDRQSYRQDVYKSLLQASKTSRYPRVPTLLAWAEPTDPTVSGLEDFSVSANSLLAVPIEYRHTAPNTEVFIPSVFMTFDPVVTDNGGLSTAYDPRNGQWREGSDHTQQLLRFTIPESVRPLKLNRVDVKIELTAPDRLVTLSAGGRDHQESFAEIDDGLGSYQYAITDPSLLATEADGSYYMRIHVHESQRGQNRSTADSGSTWKINFLSLEVTGRTAEVAASVPSENRSIHE